MADYDAIRGYYDRLGRGQDTQRFYEDPATSRLVNLGDFSTASSVIELGCGTGRFARELLSRHLPPDANYQGFELSEGMVTIASSRLESWRDRAVVSRIAAQPPLAVGDQDADRVVSNYVLDLMSSVEARDWLSELHRVLKPDGLLCLVSLTPGATGLSRFVSNTWTRIWRRRPMMVGGCRPIELLTLLPDDEWRVTHSEVVTAWAVSSEVVIARRI